MFELAVVALGIVLAFSFVRQNQRFDEIERRLNASTGVKATAAEAGAGKQFAPTTRIQKRALLEQKARERARAKREKGDQ